MSGIDPEERRAPGDRFSDLSFYILESLKTLSASVSSLQRSFTTLELSIVSKSDIKELREELEKKFQGYTEKIDRHEKDIIELKIKALIVAAGASVLVSILVKRLLG